MTKLQRALDAIDAANSEDPNVEVVAGDPHPKELLYGHRMSRRLGEFAPDASEELQLAARAQHLRRWSLPREDYPMTKAGYHAWRSEQKRRHAADADGILGAVGYPEDVRARVGELLQKKRLKSDPEVQTLEDVVCLVFLEHHLEDFAGKHPREKVVDILRKTWGKMSGRGQEAALALPLPPTSKGLVEAALGS